MRFPPDAASWISVPFGIGTVPRTLQPGRGDGGAWAAASRATAAEPAPASANVRGSRNLRARRDIEASVVADVATGSIGNRPPRRQKRRVEDRVGAGRTVTKPGHGA